MDKKIHEGSPYQIIIQFQIGLGIALFSKLVPLKSITLINILL